MRATDALSSRCKSLIHAALELSIVVTIPDTSPVHQLHSEEASSDVYYISILGNWFISVLMQLIHEIRKNRIG